MRPVGREASRRTAVLAAALLLGPAAGAGVPPADPPRWRLEPGGIAEYSLFPVTVTGQAPAAERKRGAEKPFGVFGHRIVGNRSPRPLQPDVGQLGTILALTVPQDAAGGKETLLFPAMGDCGPVEAEGTWTAAPRADGRIAFRTEVELRRRGPLKSSGFSRILVDGRVEASCVFDPARGVVEEASWDLRARTVPDEGPVKDRKPADVRDSGDLVLRRVRDGKDPEFQKDVDAAIAAGVAWLLKQPKDDAYPAYEGYPGGTDGLAALALYACDGERKAGDSALARAMRFEPERTYQIAVTMMAIDMRRTPPGEAALLRAGKIARPVRKLTDPERAWMQKGADTLVRNTEAPGRWSYPSAHGGRIIPTPPDLSNSQYGVLGLLAAHRCGIAVEDSVWLASLRAFLHVQERDGPAVGGWFPSYRQVHEAGGEGSAPTAPSARARGFPYRAGDESTGTMTCAGIGSLAICRDVLRENGGPALPVDVSASADRAVADGFGWIHAHYTVEQASRTTGRPQNWLHYYLYALERAGILADVVRVNEHDWYADGALHLLLTQDKEGWWTEEPGSAPRKIADTCFALLFLKRAVTPVATR
jgi:hypothetical protein